jgi:hypothetical protein
MNAKLHDLKRIFFGGFFIRGHPYTMDTISWGVRAVGHSGARAVRHAVQRAMHNPNNGANNPNNGEKYSEQWCEQCDAVQRAMYVPCCRLRCRAGCGGVCAGAHRAARDTVRTTTWAKAPSA